MLQPRILCPFVLGQAVRCVKSSAPCFLFFQSMRIGVERGIVAIVAAQVLEDVGEMVSMSWAAVPNDRDRREATTIRRM